MEVRIAGALPEEGAADQGAGMVLVAQECVLFFDDLVLGLAVLSAAGACPRFHKKRRHNRRILLGC